MDVAADDAALWAAVLAGEADAYAVLFRRHAPHVYRHCFRRTADWSAAEDMTSVVFLEAWRRRRDLQVSGGSVLPWLLGVANNVLRNRARSMRRHRAALERLPVGISTPDPADDVAGRVDDERRMRHLLGLIEQLPRADQDVLALCVWAGLGYADAAVALGTSIGSVRSRLSRARARLDALEQSAPGAVPSARAAGPLPCTAEESR